MTIVDGVYTSLGGGLLYIGVIEKDVDPNATRMIFYNGEKVLGEHTINTRIISIDACSEEIKIASADKFGSVAVSDGDYVDFEFIEGPGTGEGKYGYLSRLKFIGSDLYACGDLCQVYMRSSGDWISIDEGIRVHDKKSVGQALNDIDGFSQEEIYAVGDRGLILCMRDGEWQIVYSSGNESLENVVCHKDGFVYIVSDNGTLIRGRNDEWESWISPGNKEQINRLWGVNFFQNEIYCCSANDLYKVTGEQLEKVEIPIEQKGSYFKLVTGLDLLWLFSANQLLSFNGSEWKEHQILS